MTGKVPNGLVKGVVPTTESDKTGELGWVCVVGSRARGVTALGKALTGVVQDGASNRWTLPVSSLTCASFSSMR